MTAVPPAQAAHDAFSGAEAYQCMMGNPSWETITETYRLIWRFAAWAAFEAARAPESYSRPELRLGECPLHPAQREVQVRSRGEWLCLRQFLDLHEQPQPAPELRAGEIVYLYHWRFDRGEEFGLYRHAADADAKAAQHADEGLSEVLSMAVLGRPEQPAPELAAAMADPDDGYLTPIDVLEQERDQIRERLDVIEERIGNLAAGLKLSASASQPSKKSEIEMSVHRALLALLDPR